MYSSKELSRYIIANVPGMTNPKLQRLLYLMWEDYYDKTGRPLFYPDFVAGPLGPVDPSSYNEYAAYGNRVLKNGREIPELKDEDKSIIDGFLCRFGDMDIRELCLLTTRKGEAWDRVYKDGAGKGEVIPVEMIQEDIARARKADVCPPGL